MVDRGSVLTFVSLVALGLGLAGLVNGSVRFLGITSRKGAGGLVAASVLAFFASGGLSPLIRDASSFESPSPSPTQDFVVDNPSPLQPLAVPPEAQEATVVQHIDGDTLWLIGGTLPRATGSTVRLLEIDAPEVGTPYSTEATNFLKQELPVGSKVYLLADLEDRDGRGRYLRYLWKENGEFFNEKAVRLGYVKALLIPPNDRYIDQIRAAEAEARAARRGIWALAPSPSPASPLPSPTRSP
ncbi:MAG: thermonuclease family protein [Actinomycetota bacterium]|nr:thermonuclease family protein [Actinomycetota bacterium]